jgi:hypothetical protein
MEVKSKVIYSRPGKWGKRREENQKQSKEEITWEKRCRRLVKYPATAFRLSMRSFRPDPS